MSRNPIVFPDAEAVVIEHVARKLLGFGWSVPVVRRIPNPRPATFVRILRTGGTRATLVTEAAQLTVDVWSNEPTFAAELAQLVAAIMRAAPPALVGGTPCYLVEDLSTPADLPDPSSNQPRHTFSVLMHLRGQTQIPDPASA